MAETAHSLIPLDNVDPVLVEHLLDRAFGEDRHARTAYRIREGTEYLPALSFAALDDQTLLAGTIQTWPIALTDKHGRAHPMLMIGPVAVLPERQGQGFGKALMLATLGALSPQTPLPQVMIGDPEYYGRFFDFQPQPTKNWHCPGPYDPARLLIHCDNPAVLPEEGMLGPWRG